MAQHDYVIDNSTGANVRADINNVLLAISSNNSGSSAPSTNYASQFFANTNTSFMQLRNTANNAHINLFSLAGAPAFPVDGTINSVKSVEDYFKSKKNGHIALVSSPVGYRGLPKSTGYTPSKAALNNFTQGIFFDFKKYNVMVTLVSPGFIKTQLTDKNDFPMPFLKSPEYSAEKIYNGIKNKKFEIIFPFPIAVMYWVFRILPNKIYNFFISKFVNR